MASNSRMVLQAKGSYQDTLIWRSTSGFTRREERPWRSNQIQDSALRSLSERIIGASEQTSGNYSDWGSIRIMKLGAGALSWDTTAPTKDTAQEDLTSPQWNKEVLAGNFQFLDASSNAVTEDVSKKFRLVVTIGNSEANGVSLREFGLFTGLATNNPSTWNMFNWVSHPVIYKDANLSIERTIDIQFGIDRS